MGAYASTALVLPFDPTEVVPEFTADAGTKRGEEVDFAILSGGSPAILIEVKAWNESRLRRQRGNLRRGRGSP